MRIFTNLTTSDDDMPMSVDYRSISILKKFLKDNDLAFEYIDVDQSPLEEVRKIKKYLFDLKGKISYPTIIVDNKTLISGFQVDRLREVLEL